MDPFVKQALASAGVQACRSLIYLNTHSSIRARSTFTSSSSLPLFILSSSSSSITLLSVPPVLSCCPCRCSSGSVITPSRRSTYLRSAVVVKMEGLTSGWRSGVTCSGPASSLHSRCLASAEQNRVSAPSCAFLFDVSFSECVSSVRLLFLGFFLEPLQVVNSQKPGPGLDPEEVPSGSC